MRRDTGMWLIAVAVLAMALFAGCGKSKKTSPQAQMPGAYGQPPGGMPGAYGQPPGGMPGAYGQPPGGMPGAYGQPPSGMPGQMPGAYGQQQMQPAAAQSAQPEEAEPAGPSYRERYKQGDLTAQELQQEHALQKVERELGYPVGPE